MESFNDAEDRVILAAAQTLFEMIVAVAGDDGRRHRRPRQIEKATVRNNTWENVEAGPNDGWYRANLQVNRATFNQIVEMIEDYAISAEIQMPAANAYVDLRKQVAMTLKYLAQESGFQDTATIFGVVSKATTIRAINRILDILYTLSPSVISFPKTEEKWKEIMEGFYQTENYPGVVGVVDGSLFAIERPTDYEGWICRKGFAAVNMQATVDHNAKFMEYSLRPGSSSDKNLWSKSSLGKNIQSILPPTTHLLGDAGYTISEYLMIPYPITNDMSESDRQYNSYHSRTRITVERAFGLLKGRWRILKKKPVSQPR